MDSAPDNKRKEKFLEKKYIFRRNALLIIDKMLELGSEIQSYILVDEVLHSIFFLGGINNPQFLPTEILADDQEILNNLESFFPQAFNCFQSKLPSRSPMSCVMDMIINVTKQKMKDKLPSSVEDEILRCLQEITCNLKEDEISGSAVDEILRSLRKRTRKLNEGEISSSVEDEIPSSHQEPTPKPKKIRATELISSTVCVSQPNEDCNSTRYYGVSMSTSGRNPGRVVVAAACLNNWEEYVAGAVMTYYPNQEKNPDFDGTFKLPDEVRCQAFNLSRLEKMDPCKSCANVFGFRNHSGSLWAYGNCAENESISSLLYSEEGVKKRVRLSAPSKEGARNKAKKSMLEELWKYLEMLKFKWDGDFYTPR